jgi:uncharacterized protein YecT (DUF1311 family)
MHHSARLVLFAALVALAGCGEPIDQKAISKTTPAAPPVPVPVSGTPVSAKSPLEICLQNAASTPATDACFAGEMKVRNEALTQYVAAAIKRITDAQESSAEFEKGQTAWVTYREAHCGAVYEHWKDGTIRSAKAATCNVDLTAERTHQVWKDYLTFPDSTPPVLPEPAPAD